MVGVLAQHGYVKTVEGDMRPKPYRPKTIADARRLIFEVFERCRWDLSDQERYFKGKGIAARRLEDLAPEDIRAVLAAMEKRRMIIFQD